MNRMSMSASGLAAKCLYGFRLDVRQFPRPIYRATQVGTVTHHCVEKKRNGAANDHGITDTTIIADAETIFAGPLSGFVDSRPWTACEIGMRYDSINDTATEGPKRGEPGYDDVIASVLRGTLDLVHVEGDTGLVVDVKTGKPPTDSEQLYAQAVAVSRRYKLKTVRVQYARALKTKLDILGDELLDADRLDAEAGRIARRLRLVPTSEPNAGEWCFRCDARPGCPAHQRDDEYVPAEMPPTELYDDNARLSF